MKSLISKNKKRMEIIQQGELHVLFSNDVLRRLNTKLHLLIVN